MVVPSDGATEGPQVRKPIIGVIGAAVGDSTLELVAFDVGRLIARLGCILVCGGLGGVMEGASRGARSGGADVIGILPGPSVNDANPYVTHPVATNLGHARNVLIAHTAHCLVAIGGGYGTLSEIAIGLKLGKPVFSLGPHHRVQGLIQTSSIQELEVRLRQELGLGASSR